VADGGSSWLDGLLRAIGVNPVSFRWRWRRRQERLRAWWNATENRSRAVTYQHKTCTSCGTPVDRDATVCPRCGTALSGLLASRAGKLLGLLVPEGAFVYTTILGLAIVALFGAMVMRGGLAMLFARTAEDNRLMSLLGLQLGASTVPYFMEEGVGGFPHLHRLITNLFVHFGLLHVIFNFYALLQLGPLLEEVYGRSRFLFVFLATGVAGSAASLYWHWDRPAVSAGASSALFGLIGASLVYGWRKGGSYGRSLASEMIRWGIFALLFGLLVPGVDNAAHVGGAAAGALLALVLNDATTPSRVSPSVWLAIEVTCLAAVVGSFALLFALDDPVYQGLRVAWMQD
jgi:rhomboid protease GluP